MSAGVVNEGALVWSGEHWINYLRRSGAGQDCGMYIWRSSLGGDRSSSVFALAEG